MAFFVPIDGTTKSELINGTINIGIRIRIDPSGVNIIFTDADLQYGLPSGGFSYSETNVGKQSGYNKWSALLDNVGKSYISGDLANQPCIIEFKTGTPGTWYTIFTGYVSDEGLKRQAGAITNDKLQLDMYDLTKIKGTRRKPDSTILETFQIVDTTTPGASVLHYLADLMGISSSDVTTEDIAVSLVAQKIGNATLWAELQSMAYSYLADLYFRYDGKLLFRSPFDAGSDTTEWSIVADATAAISGDETYVRSTESSTTQPISGNRVKIVADLYTQDTDNIVFRATDNYDKTTDEIYIVIEPGEYYPGGTDGTDDTMVAELDYQDAISNKDYAFASGVTSPTLSKVDSTADIWYEGGTLSVDHFSAKAEYAEIRLYNSGASNAVIKRFVLTGNPYLNDEHTVINVDSAVVADEDYIDQEIDGKWIATYEQADITTAEQVARLKGRRSVFKIMTNFLPQVQAGALIDYHTADGRDLECKILSFNHAAYAESTGTYRTTLTIIEFGTFTPVRDPEILKLANNDSTANQPFPTWTDVRNDGGKPGDYITAENLAESNVDLVAFVAGDDSIGSIKAFNRIGDDIQLDAGYFTGALMQEAEADYTTTPLTSIQSSSKQLTVKCLTEGNEDNGLTGSTLILSPDPEEQTSWFGAKRNLLGSDQDLTGWFAQTGIIVSDTGTKYRNRYTIYKIERTSTGVYISKSFITDFAGEAWIALYVKKGTATQGRIALSGIGQIVFTFGANIAILSSSLDDYYLDEINSDEVIVWVKYNSFIASTSYILTITNDTASSYFYIAAPQINENGNRTPFTLSTTTTTNHDEMKTFSLLNGLIFETVVSDNSLPLSGTLFNRIFDIDNEFRVYVRKTSAIFTVRIELNQSPSSAILAVDIPLAYSNLPFYVYGFVDINNTSLLKIRYGYNRSNNSFIGEITTSTWTLDPSFFSFAGLSSDLYIGSQMGIGNFWKGNIYSLSILNTDLTYFYEEWLPLLDDYIEQHPTWDKMPEISFLRYFSEFKSESFIGFIKANAPGSYSGNDIEVAAGTQNKALSGADEGVAGETTTEFFQRVIDNVGGLGGVMQYFAADSAFIRTLASEVIKLLDFSEAGTCGTGSTTTAIVLGSGASIVDDRYNFKSITIGAETRTITDYVGSTKTATVSVAFSGAPSSGTAYSITGYGAIHSDYYNPDGSVNSSSSATLGFFVDSQGNLKAQNGFFGGQLSANDGAFGNLVLNNLFSGLEQFTTSDTYNDLGAFLESVGVPSGGLAFDNNSAIGSSTQIQTKTTTLSFRWRKVTTTYYVEVYEDSVQILNGNGASNLSQDLDIYSIYTNAYIFGGFIAGNPNVYIADSTTPIYNIYTKFLTASGGLGALTLPNASDVLTGSGAISLAGSITGGGGLQSGANVGWTNYLAPPIYDSGSSTVSNTTLGIGNSIYPDNNTVSGATTLAAGIYQFMSNGNTRLEMYNGSSWVGAGGGSETIGLVMFSGDVRLRNATATSNTLYYWKV